MIRYSQITEKLPRELLLLQGQGCAWRRCAFCDYHLDVSENAFEINSRALENVTGGSGVLDIINSGSCTELDARTLALIAETVREKRIHTLWFEAHWMYRDRLADFAARFVGVSVKFRTGVETFDTKTRAAWDKGIPDSVAPSDLARFFDGVCLLCCVKGQTREMISRDIETALRYFEYFSVNLFVENSTNVRRDDTLVRWFEQTWIPRLRNEPSAEVLQNNTDLGVG